MLDGDFEHLLDLCRRTDQGSSNALAQDCLGLNTGESLLGQTDLHDVSSRLEQWQEQCVEWHVGGETGTDEKIESSGVLLEQGFGVLGDENTVGAHRLAVGLLGLAGGQGKGLGAEGLGELDAQMSETADSDNSHTLAGTSAVVAQGGEDGDT